MIHITVSPKKYQVRIKGHAEYAEPGKDILCASVSYAFYNLCAMMLKFEKNGMLCKSPRMKDNPGNSFVEVVPKEIYEGNVQLCFMYFTEGLQSLMAQYPEFIDLKVLKY